MPSKRVLIVGGVAGGASCATRLRRLDEHAEIVLFERGSAVSFANCGLPYYLGGVIQNRQQLLVATVEQFDGDYAIDAMVHHRVTRIDRSAQRIEVTNLQTGQTTLEPYDYLVLAPGAAPVRPKLPGVDLPEIYVLRNLDDVDRLQAKLSQGLVKRVVVVGGGFIGLEVVENLRRRGLQVILLEALSQVMPPMDPEMVVPVHAVLREQGVDLHLSDPVAAFEPGPGQTLNVIAQSGRRFVADMVLLAVGVRPDVELARGAGLEIGEQGGIRVDDQMRTSDARIFAVGDAVETRDVVTGQWTLTPLAGPASRQGRVAADAICGRPTKFRGTQGTSVVGVFGMVLGMTGASEKRLRAAGIPFEKIYTHSPSHATYYPGAEMMTIKLLYAPQTGRILGAQVVGRLGVDKRIDVLAMALQKGATVFDLEEAELCYAPQFGSARDPLNIAGFAAANALRGDVDVVHWDQWQERHQSDPDSLVVIDVRPPGMISSSGKVPETINIPL
jgi:NADPH-dependent 2,4-dienoyl-CoA reductase/sulfur reductase-like enzyme